VGSFVEYVEALGGHLEIRAVFPDRQVLITYFDVGSRVAADRRLKIRFVA